MADPQEQSQSCDRCEGPASLFCLDCNFPFCTVCFDEVHRKGRYHQRKEIGIKINPEVPSSETTASPASNPSGSSESTPSDTTPASTPDNSIIQEKTNESANSTSQNQSTENANSQPSQSSEPPAQKPASETPSQNTTESQSQPPLDKSEKRKSQWIQPARSPRVAARTFLTRTPTDPAKVGEISPSPTNSESEYPKVTTINADQDIGESSFFNFMQRPPSSSSLEDSTDSQRSVEDTMETEKAKFLRLMEEERRKSELEKKALEDQIQQEEQLRVQMTNIYAQRKEDHIKEVQGLSLENLQLKEGIESLQAEIKRIQQEKHTLQEQIKTHFSNMDQENKQLQKTVDALNGELGAIKKDKKTLIDKITEMTLGKVAKSPSTTQLVASPAPIQSTQTNS